MLQFNLNYSVYIIHSILYINVKTARVLEAIKRGILWQKWKDNKETTGAEMHTESRAEVTLKGEV